MSPPTPTGHELVASDQLSWRPYILECRVLKVTCVRKKTVWGFCSGFQTCEQLFALSLGTSARVEQLILHQPLHWTKLSRSELRSDRYTQLWHTERKLWKIWDFKDYNHCKLSGLHTLCSCDSWISRQPLLTLHTKSFRHQP